MTAWTCSLEPAAIWYMLLCNHKPKKEKSRFNCNTTQHTHTTTWVRALFCYSGTVTILKLTKMLLAARPGNSHESQTQVPHLTEKLNRRLSHHSEMSPSPDPSVPSVLHWLLSHKYCRKISATPTAKKHNKPIQCMDYLLQWRSQLWCVHLLGNLVTDICTKLSSVHGLRIKIFEKLVESTWAINGSSVPVK